MNRKLVVCVAAVGLGLGACKKAPVAPPQAKVPAGVAAFTRGTVSRETVVKVQFTEAVVEAAKVGATLDERLFETEPRIEGTTIWSDRETLELRPQKPLEPGRVYVIRLPVDRLMTVTSGEKTLEFGFTVMRQSFEVRRDGLEAVSEADGAAQRWRGAVTTADVADAADLEHMVEATLGGKSLTLAWTHSDDRRTHELTIGGITRGDKDSELVVRWDGSAIGAEGGGEEKVNVPGLATFAVAQVRAVQDAEQYVEVRFSDPLDRRQKLAGLVRAGGEPGRLVVDGSVLRVYGRARFGEQVELVIEPGVKNFRGYALKERYTETVAFAPLTPEVRFGSKGVFVPTTEGLTIPIETANLRAIVVEAVRVPEQNIPQFLQVNGLDGANEMHRVGRVVWKQVIDLGVGADKKNRWVRTGLDVKPLIAKSPGGLYRLRLSFGRQHILYDCAGAAPAEEVDLQSHDDDFGKPESEQSYWDYAEEDGDGSEDYQQRKDPCSAAFYRGYPGRLRSVTRNVLVTDVGLVAKVGGDGSLFVAATDLRTAAPLTGVEVQVLDFQQQALATGKTDGDGTVRLTVDHRPFVVIARSGEQRGFLKLDDGSALTLSHFDVSGAAVTKGIKGKLYGERGVWRPGDEIFLTFVLYDPDGHIPTDHPVRFELVDPRGRLVDSQLRRDSVNGFYAFRTRTAPDAPTGGYTARVRVGGATFEEGLKVEMVRPNRLKIGLDFHTDMIRASDAIDGKLSSTWLHGAIARDLKAEVKVALARRPTTFKAFGDYVFDDPARRFESEVSSLFEGSLDDKGEARVEGKLALQGEAPGLLTATFGTRVFEPGGAYSTDMFSVPFSPYDHYIGIKTPKGDAARGMLLTDTKHPLSIVAVRPDGGRVEGDVTVECKLYKLDWRWWWDKGEDGSLASYVESRSHQALATGTVKLVNGEGTWPFEVKYPEWGRYLLLARDVKGGHRTGKIVYIDWPGWAGRAQKDNPGGASVLAFAADKQEYSVGETVTLTIPSADKGRGLVSIESGTKVVQAAWIDAKGAETRYSFQVTPEMAPNVYVHVTMVQPHLQAKNDLPIRMYGVVPIKVVDPETRLTPVIETADVFAPESKAQVAVKEAKGRAMTYTLAVVDEGLLGLTRFGTPNLWDTFYRREALGVRTWDVYDLVAGAYGASLERMLAIGGGDDAAAQGGQKANRFPPMVRFYGPFALEKDAVGTHTIDVPRYLGAVRVMVVAGAGRAFGSADKSVFVRKPLLLLATLPRVLGPEETVDLPVTVFALEDKVKKAVVRVSAAGPVAVEGEATRTLSFSGPGDRTISFKLGAKAATGVARVDVSVEGAGEKAAQSIEIDVRMPGVRVTDVVAGVLEPGKGWSQKVQLPGFPGTNTALLEVSRVPPLDLGRRLDYLVQYPHGCVEQTTSSAFPQLYLSSLLDLSSERKATIETNVRAGIERLRLFQTASGGFSYWPGEGQADDWASSYAGHFLAEARKAGYLVQDAMLDPWKRYQKNRANGFSPASGHGQTELDQAYRLYSLALAGAPELGAMNRLKESGKLPVAALWQLAAAYRLAGKPEVAVELTRSAALTVPRYRELDGTYGSDLRDRAIVLEALYLIGDYQRALPVAKEISDALSRPDGWLSTQEIAYALVSMARFAQGTKGEDLSRFSYTLAGGGAKAVESKAVIAQEKLAVGRGDSLELALTNTGSKPLYARVLASGLPKYDTESDAQNGLKLEVAYKNTSGDAIDASSIEQGTDFVAEVTVTNVSARGQLQNLALSSLVASGWEIRNQRIEGAVAAAQGTFDFQDVRDDRVYTYFGLKPSEARTFKLVLNASYTGRFYLPLGAVEAMYDGTVNGRVRGRWVEVTRAGLEVAAH